jgi:hypothetical protein
MLYSGAASGDFGPARLNEAATLYEAAAQFYYNDEGTVRTMRYKLAIILLLQEKTDDAEKILRELDEQKHHQLGNQLRTELIRQIADALLSYKKNVTNPSERRKLLRQFLHQFTIPSNAASADGLRRETLELRLFCAEFLLNDALKDNDFQAMRRDLSFLIPPFEFFVVRTGSRPFIRRICDKIIRTEAILYENSTDPALKQIQIVRIVRCLEGMRLQIDTETKIPPKTPPASTSSPLDSGELNSGAVPSLVVFFLTEEPKDGFVIFYPQDDRAGELFRLPLTRKQIKTGVKKPDEEWKLNPKLLQLIQEERRAGRNISISWNDEPSWNRPEDALTNADWPFEEELPIR